MTTVVQLINDSLREIRVLAEGETASADMIEDAKRVLVDLLASFTVDGFKVPYYAIETLTLSTTKSAYTWRPGGDINSVAPLSPNDLIAVSWIFGTLQRPLRPMSVTGLLHIPYPSIVSSPMMFYYDLQTIPVLRLDVVPIGGVLKLASHKPLDTSFGLVDDLEFPPSYNRMLRTNLAVDLCPGYNKEVGPTLAAIANKSRSAVEKVNAQPIPQMVSDAAGVNGGRFDQNPITSPW